MKKLLLSVAVVAAMLCSLSGLAYADDGKDLQPEAAGAVSVVLDAGVVDVIGENVPAPEAEFVPGTVPAQSAALDGVIPPVNALVLSMLEQGLTYDDTDEVFLWNSLYYMISLYGQMDSRAELTDDMLIIPSETAADYAAALFSNYHGLPALPEQMQDRVSYDPDSDTYSLARGDAGLAEIRLDSVQELADGAVLVTGSLMALEDESSLCRFEAQLIPNQSMFGYSVCGLNIA